MAVAARDWTGCTSTSLFFAFESSPAPAGALAFAVSGRDIENMVESDLTLLPWTPSPPLLVTAPDSGAKELLAPR